MSALAASQAPKEAAPVIYIVNSMYNYGLLLN